LQHREDEECDHDVYDGERCLGLKIFKEAAQIAPPLPASIIHLGTGLIFANRLVTEKLSILGCGHSDGLFSAQGNRLFSVPSTSHHEQIIGMQQRDGQVPGSAFAWGAVIGDYREGHVPP
jgi:hypothetical protein